MTAAALARLVDNGLDQDEMDVVDVVRDMLATTGPPHELVARFTAGPSSDRAAHRRLCGDMELLAMGVPEQMGGHGAPLRLSLMVLRELGRSAAGGTFLPVWVAVQALVEAGVSPPEEVLAGDRLLVLADAGVGDVSVVPRPDLGADKVELTGAVRHVVLGAHTDDLVVAVPGPHGVLLALVPAPADRDEQSFTESVDQSRPVHTVDLAGVVATVIADDSEGIASRVRASTHRRYSMALAAEQVGAAEAALQMMVEHAGVRHQFGQPIGSFQAIKHLCADAAVKVEAARSTLLANTDAVEDASVTATMKNVCVEAAVSLTQALVQVLGGTGYTWEHPAHCYLKRALGARFLGGSTRHHRDAIAEALLTRTRSATGALVQDKEFRTW